jgi:hypothetical protein
METRERVPAQEDTSTQENTPAQNNIPAQEALDTSAEASPINAHSETDVSASTATSRGCVDENSAPLIWEFDVFDLFSLESQGRVVRQLDSVSPALDLMQNGYVAKTPGKPQVAVTVRTLELLYRLRNRKASFSIEAFAKVVCDYYSVYIPLIIQLYVINSCIKRPYRHYIRNIFADTFEVYLRILRLVDKRVHAVLGWDSPDWRPLNACRACCYKVWQELFVIYIQYTEPRSWRMSHRCNSADYTLLTATQVSNVRLFLQIGHKGILGPLTIAAIGCHVSMLTTSQVKYWALQKTHQCAIEAVTPAMMKTTTGKTSPQLIAMVLYQGTQPMDYASSSNSSPNFPVQVLRLLLPFHFPPDQPCLQAP